MEKETRVLVLSCNTGEGHNSAGQAVCEELQTRNIYCEVVDSLGLAGESVSRLISQSYTFMSTKIPPAFHMLYKTGDIVSRLNGVSRKSPVYYANRLYANKIQEFVRNNQFDVVVASHLFPAEAITSLKKREHLPFKMLSIVTDYTCHPFWEETYSDGIIAAHKDLVPEFLDRGIPADRIFPFGIPVKQAFLTKVPKEEARKYLHLDIDKPMVLIMTGSMGYGHLDTLLGGLSHKMGESVNIVVLCGKNERIQSSLTQRFMAFHNIIFKGFTKEVPLYMDACDVIFTKPGGLTSTETAVKNIPLIHTNPIPGCETENASFFMKRGMAYTDPDVEKQINMASILCSNATIRNRMLEAQRKNVNRFAAKEIADKIESLVAKNADKRLYV